MHFYHAIFTTPARQLGRRVARLERLHRRAANSPPRMPVPLSTPISPNSCPCPAALTTWGQGATGSCPSNQQPRGRREQTACRPRAWAGWASSQGAACRMRGANPIAAARRARGSHRTGSAQHQSALRRCSPHLACLVQRWRMWLRGWQRPLHAVPAG
eukprot:scaffold25989_cov32-Tisochrysis_lutea.AAC.1